MGDEDTAPGEAEPKTEAPAVAEASVVAEPEAELAPEKPRKKKKKAKVAAEAEATSSTDPRALEIAAAFDAGDFARIRELGPELVKSDDAALAAIGRDYLARIAVDPIQIAFLGLCAAVLLAIAWIYIPH